MPENTSPCPSPPMESEDIVSAFAYIRALQAHDVALAVLHAHQRAVLPFVLCGVLGHCRALR
jgi:hypothetical protein